MSVLTLAEAKAFLDISDAAHDSKVQGAIDAAESLIAEKVGPLTPTTVTDRITSNGAQIMLRTTPVISLTTVSSVYATQTADVASLFVSPAGVVTWSTGRNVFFGGPYDVTYQAGYASIPAGLKYGIQQMVRHLWRSQRGPQGRSPEGEAAPRYLFPNEVLEAIEPYVQDFGFA